jgi:hypothetical protein
MTQRQTVILPNGQQIDAPVGVSQAEIKDKAIRSGLISADEFKTQPTPTVEQKDSPLYKDVYNAVKNNLDIPASIYGGIKGAQYGARFGPKGMVVGTILGAVPTGIAGNLTSDLLQGEEPDYGKAVNEALIGMGFDAATLGTFKLLKPLYLSGQKALGFGAKETAEQIAKELNKVSAAGTPESLRATQQILTERGASLTQFQTGKAPWWAVFAEKLGESGILSKQFADQNIATVNRAASEAIQELTDGIALRTTADSASIGQGVLDVVSSARVALQDAYGEGLDDILSKIGNKQVDISAIKAPLQKFLNKDVIVSRGFKEVVDPKTGKIVKQPFVKETTALSKDSLKYIDDNITSILDAPMMDVRSLLLLDKRLSKELRQLGDIKGNNYNEAAHREIGELQDILKDTMVRIIGQADPKVAQQYKNLKSSYKQGLEGLLPKINKNVILKAQDADYDAIGNLLVRQTNVSKIQSMLSSVDEAYRQLGRAGAKKGDIPYNTAKEAKKAIRAGFLKNLLPDLGEASFDIKTYSNLAKEYSKPNNDKRLKVIMGEDYGRVKQLFNLFSEASESPTGNLGTIFLRGKEYSGASALIATGAGGATAGFGGAAVGLGAVLGIPFVLAKITSSPRAVNRLLAFEKKQFKSPKAMETASLLVVGDIMELLTDEEKAEVRETLRPKD